MSLTENSEPRPNELTLAGLLAAMLEQWKWFIVVPLLIGTLALVAVSFQPREYVSSAVVRGDQSTVLISSAGVLSPTVEEFKLHSNGEGLGEAVRRLERSISLRPLTPEAYKISINWDNAEQAQAILSSLLANLSQHLRPNGKDRALLEAQLALAKQHFDDLQRYAGLFSNQRTLTAVDKIFARTGDAAVGYVALVDQIGKKQQEIHAVERQLEGLSNEDIVQPPTPPVEVPGPSKIVYAFLFASASAIAVGAVIVILEWFRLAAAGSHAKEFLRMRKVLRSAE